MLDYFVFKFQIDYLLVVGYLMCGINFVKIQILFLDDGNSNSIYFRGM